MFLDEDGLVAIILLAENDGQKLARITDIGSLSTSVESVLLLGIFETLRRLGKCLVLINQRQDIPALMSGDGAKVVSHFLVHLRPPVLKAANVHVLPPEGTPPTHQVWCEAKRQHLLKDLDESTEILQRRIGLID